MSDIVNVMDSSDSFRVLSAKDAIAEEIRKLIHRGELAPGARISIEDLAKRFGLSRTPVRDALFQLSAEGLTSIQSRVGVFVRVIDDQESLDVYRIKAALEPLLAKWAATRGSEEQRAAYLRSANELREAAEAQDLPRYIAKLEERRDELFVMADSTPMKDAFSLLEGRVRLLRFKNLSEATHLAASAEENIRVAVAINEGDAELAELLARRHAEVAVERVKLVLQQQHNDRGQSDAV